MSKNNKNKSGNEGLLAPPKIENSDSVE